MAWHGRNIWNFYAWYGKFLYIYIYIDGSDNRGSIKSGYDGMINYMGKDVNYPFQLSWICGDMLIHENLYCLIYGKSVKIIYIGSHMGVSINGECPNVWFICLICIYIIWWFRLVYKGESHLDNVNLLGIDNLLDLLGTFAGFHEWRYPKTDGLFGGSPISGNLHMGNRWTTSMMACGNWYVWYGKTV